MDTPSTHSLRAAVENLQGRDFILVFGNEFFEGLDCAFGALAGRLAEVGLQQAVLRDGVYDLLGFAFQVD